MNLEQIQFLLRERAKTKMPEGYAQQLLEQLHQRQRTELLHRSVWRIASDRISTFLSEHSLSTPQYALGLAGLLALCLGVIALLKPLPGGATVAKQDKALKIEGPLLQKIETQQVSYEKQ